MVEHLFIRLAGSPEQSIQKVRLYPEKKIVQWRSLIHEAQEKIGGFTTGLGFIGSPAWVIGGAALLGALEAHLSNKLTKDGLEKIKKAGELLEGIRRSGQLFTVPEIRNIDQPAPELWQARSNPALQNVKLNEWEQTALANRGYLTPAQAKMNRDAGGAVESFAVLGDEFLEVEGAAGRQWLRWAAVTSYQLR